MAGKNTRASTDRACDLLGGFFTTLAHRTRMSIFCALQDEAKPVTEIAAYAHITVANASQHLRLMRDKGAVVAERRGQFVYYRIADARILQAAAMIREALAEQMLSKARGGDSRLVKDLRAADFIPHLSRAANSSQPFMHKGAHL